VLGTTTKRSKVIKQRRRWEEKYKERRRY